MVDQPPPLVRPVPGAVVAPFTYVRADPFAAGRRRVLRLRATEGASVRAPCSGRVRFAGRTPRGGYAVAVRCGPWSATVTGVAVATRRAGARVAAGTPVGRADGRRSVGLGLRLARDPFGYVDPAPRLREPPGPGAFSPLGPAPRGRPTAPRVAPGPHAAPDPRAVPVPRGAPVPRGVPLPRSEPVAVPATAWAGLALAALGLPAGVAGRRRVLRLRSVGASDRVAAR
jgi:hypothetical protein